MILDNRRSHIINNDVLITKEIPTGVIDLIITSPPYNLEIDYGSTDDKMDYEDYLTFSSQWLERCLLWLKEDGRICLNVPLDSNKNGHKPNASHFIQRALDIGYQYRSTIIWNKNHIPTRTAWGSWLSASSPSVICHVEVILVFYKSHWKKIERGESTINRSEFIEWTNGLWSFPGETRKGEHPAPFPIELPDRCIKLFSYKDDLILDPFCGSGTTLLAAYRNGRRSIGVEIDQEYYKIACNRLQEDKVQTNFLEVIT